MPFVKWRQQLHVGLALQKLASRESVTNIAIDLGYESTSAFIAMFKRSMGTTPSRYFADDHFATPAQPDGTAANRQARRQPECHNLPARQEAAAEIRRLEGMTWGMVPGSIQRYPELTR